MKPINKIVYHEQRFIKILKIIGLTVFLIFSKRILELAIPSGATPEQIRAIQQASEYATQKGVELIVHVLE